MGGGDEFAVRGVKGEADVGVGAGGHEGGGGGGVPAEADDAVEVVEGDAEFCLFFVANLDRGSVATEVGAFEGDEEGVQVLAHVASRI